jgi:copper chaperone NosL
MPKIARILTAAASLLLLALFVFPLWSIQLLAPQYPEGLGMYIRINTIVGATEFDLAKINSLNHYIGMRPIEPAVIPELRFMPWIVGALVITGLAVAAWGRRGALKAWLFAFALIGVAGLADFYRWSYDYGHNLDMETAIIKVPGMSYQPPMLGTKQLLNFHATSWPALGGILAGVAFVLGAAALVVTSRSARRRTVAAATAALAACGTADPHMAYDGSESCDFCRMAITDARFGAQLVTTTGKTYRFDSVECLASYYAQTREGGTVRSLWVSNFANPGSFVPAEDARFVRARGPEGSPMGLGLAAFGAAPDDTVLRREYGELLDWSDVLALVEQERGSDTRTADVAAR